MLRGSRSGQGAWSVFRRPAVQTLLSPLPSELVEPRFAKIVWRHGNPEPALRVEFEEERLCEGRDARRVGDIDDEDGAPLPVLLGKIGRFGLQLGKNR